MKFTFLATIIFMLSAFAETDITDKIHFGYHQSEKSHSFNDYHTSKIKIVKESPAGKHRVLIPHKPVKYYGGKMSFTMRCTPGKQNYFTIKLWGSDITDNLLILYCEGQQVGYRHLGDIDILDHGSKEPAYAGRYYYVTCPLPQKVTNNTQKIKLTIKSTGRIWGYGRTFAKYQKDQTTESRGIYAGYLHTSPCFVPPQREKQGQVPEPTIRKTPDIKVLDMVKEKVNKDINAFLSPGRISSQMHMQFMAQAYHLKWTKAYKKTQTVKMVVAGMDRLYLKFCQNPKLAESDRSTWNHDWFGFGPAGHTIVLLEKELNPFLKENIKDDKGNLINRKEAWTKMLKTGVEYLRTHRRHYTNQSMIVDLNLYLNNRGLQVLAPNMGISEKKTLHYLYESIGLEPWSGSEDKNGNNSWPLGKEYYQLTRKGLTKELGYVGYYGEVMDWVTQIYNATRKAPDQAGDERIRHQLDKIIKARAVFRYPAVDKDGFKAMRIETVVGWRDTSYPGSVCYVARAARDGSALFAPAATLGEKAVGYSQQMLNDNQFFSSELESLKEGGFRVVFGRLHTITDYETIKSMPVSKYKLPMSEDQPDFVWSDEENGVLALKNGKDILYASLYWRARHGINNLARIHYLTPEFDRIAVVKQETDFARSGYSYKRKNWTNFGFANGGLKYPEKTTSAHDGEILPIAAYPKDIPLNPGKESPYAGKGIFYKCQYGKYLIGMNCSKNLAKDLQVPDSSKQVRDLTTNKTYQSGDIIKVPPGQTIVLVTVR